jgi:hypothetical protein
MLQKESDLRDSPARTALAQGREDLARAALQQKAGLQGQLNDLQGQYASLQRIRSGAADCDTAAKRVAGERSGHPGLTSYEAWYVALDEFLGAKLATLDRRLRPRARPALRLLPAATPRRRRLSAPARAGQRNHDHSGAGVPFRLSTGDAAVRDPHSPRIEAADLAWFRAHLAESVAQVLAEGIRGDGVEEVSRPR